MRCGHLIQLLNSVNSFRGGALTVDGRATDVSEGVGAVISADIETDFANGTALYNVIDGIQAAYASFQGSQAAFLSYIQGLAVSTLRHMATLDQSGNLNTLMTLEASLRLLVTQMVNASASVKANVPALGAQTSVGSPVGTPTIIGTIKDGTGKYSGKEYAVPETVTFLCTKDALSLGGTADQEEFTVSGQPAQANLLSWDWPKGSGGRIKLTLTDPEFDNSGGTVLQNGSLDTWTTAASPPDNWTALAGTANTDYAKDTGSTFTGTGACLKLIGASAAPASLAQTFAATPSTAVGAGGSPFDLRANPDVNFAFCMQLKCDVVPIAGVITVDLIDGSNTVVADSAGTNNSFTVTLSGASTSYVAKTGVFRIPANAPTVAKVRIRVSTAITTGTNVFIDDVSLTEMAELYAGGPEFAAVRGATKPLKNDQYTMTMTISAAGAFQRGFQKLFGLPKPAGADANFNYVLPSKADGSETCADSLVS